MSNNNKAIRFIFYCTLFYFSLINAAISAPILRIEVGQHTAMINRMAIDKDEKLLATASDDKTLRLWNLPEGTLYTTLRVPIDERLKGSLYAVAISPDGKTVITAGETIDENQKFSLYVFDVEQRVLKARIPNLPSAIYHLAYSKDGKYFAASHAYGISVWESQTGKLIAQDTEYAKHSTWLDFNAAGNLVSASHDGYVRLYDNQFKLLKKSMTNSQGKPNSVDFSENGELLAIGYFDLNQIDVVDLNLNKQVSLSVENLTTTDTALVTWQKNSNTSLYVSGDMRTNQGNFVIRHWEKINSPDKSFKDVEVSKNIVTDIISLANTEKSDALFSSADPSWGSLKSDNVVYKNQANLWDARLVELPNKTFSISDDGLQIAYSTDVLSNKLNVFNVKELTLQRNAGNSVLNSLSPSKQEDSLIKVTNWQQSIPSLNGKKLHFDDYEKSFSFAINSISDSALFGTNYYLRLYDKQGNETKKIAVPAVVYGVNVSSNGKLVIAALGDGTIRWYSLLKGEELNELVTLFPYNDGKDWIVWTKEGFFGSSDGGGYRLAGYHLNKGENKRPEWIDFSQIYQIYYAPELILPKLLRQEDKLKEKLKTIENADDRFNKNAVPIVELVEYCVNPKKEIAEVAITDTSNMSYFEKLSFFLNKIYGWFSALSSPVQNNDVVKSDSISQPICYPISGQGQTRGFTRKEKIQTTLYRNQLDKTAESIDLHYSVKPREGGMGDMDIYVNGQIQQSEKQIASTSTTNEELKFVKTLPLKEGENNIAVHVYEKSGGAVGVSNSIALINPLNSQKSDTRSLTDKPKLIILAVGIDRYASPNQLKYAVKDSTDFLRTVSEKKSSFYSDVLKFQLFDEEATLKNIENTFDKIQATLNENDAVLIYFSGHGLREKNGFYFVPYGVDDDHFDETALSQQVLKKNVAKLSKTHKVFVFMDSCHSGAVSFDNLQQEISSFDKIKQQLGDNIFILAASGEDQEAQDQFKLPDDQKANNGLFAYAVLEGLSGKARRLDDNVIDSYNLGSFVQRRIDTITQNQILYKQKARFQRLEAGDVLNFDITKYE